MGKATRQVLKERELKEAKITEALYRPIKNISNQFYRDKQITALHIMPETAYAWSNRAIRDSKRWSYRGKSRDKIKQQIDLIRWMFAKYPVPRFLEIAFLDSKSPFIEWYLAVAQGQSLYKSCSHGILSKKETHWLLKAPNELSIKEAIWWAKSMAIKEDIGIAYRMAKSVISVRGSCTEEFWIDIHRFFLNNPVQMKEMSELVDYFMAMHGENRNWTIKKRTIQSVRDHSERWHRSMAKLKSIGGGSWEGMKIDPWHATTGVIDPNPKYNTRLTWTVREICNGTDLAKEGNAMRHCVAGYKYRCMNNTTSIFSLESVNFMDQKYKNLTIEVQRNSKRIIQARGLANRLARPLEYQVMRKWANAHGITISDYL